jgi:hypothetical protein
VERPGGVGVGGTAQNPNRGLRQIERLAQFVKRRFDERDVEPEKTRPRAQASDTVSVGAVEPVEDLRHDLSD